VAAHGSGILSLYSRWHSFGATPRFLSTHRISFWRTHLYGALAVEHVQAFQEIGVGAAAAVWYTMSTSKSVPSVSIQMPLGCRAAFWPSTTCTHNEESAQGGVHLHGKKALQVSK